MAPTQKVTITCSAEDLNAKLSKAQKELGLTHDEYGRLVNAQGQFVGGLSQARVRMGDYIDAQGRMRDAQGHYLDGLTAVQQKLRMYRDEVGNLYSAEGELIEQIQAATAAQETQSDAAQRGMQSLMSGAKGAAKMANNLSLMIGVLGGGNEGLNKFGQSVVIATQSFSQFALAMKTLPKFVNGFKLLTQATQGQAAAQVFLNAVSGNWVALAAGGLAAGTLAYKALSSSTKDASSATQDLSGEYERLTRVLREYHMELTATNAEQVGFLNPAEFETTAVDEAIRKLEVLQKARGILVDQMVEAAKAGKVRKEKAYDDAIKINRDKESEQQKVIATRVNELVAKDMPVKTELEKLKERAAYYNKIIESGTLTGQALTNAQTALKNNLAKQDEIVARENEEKRRAEQEAAEKRAREVSEAQKAMESAGFDHYLRQTDEELDRFNKTVETWRANAETAGVSTGDLETAIKNYTDEFNAKRNEKGIADLGLDQYLKEPEKSPLEKYNDIFEKVREAEEKFGLDKEQANRILLSAEEEYAESLRKQAEDAERQKESRLNELGITGLREKQKTDEDRLLEQQTKIAQAVEEGLISTREANDLNNGLMQEYLEKFAGTAEDESSADGAPQKEEKTGPNASMTLGSQSLYQALTQRDDPYKSEVKQRMTELGKTQENTYTKIESLEAAVTSYLERLQERL